MGSRVAAFQEAHRVRFLQGAPNWQKSSVTRSAVFRSGASDFADHISEPTGFSNHAGTWQ